MEVKDKMDFINKLIGKEKEEVELKPDKEVIRSRNVRSNDRGEVELREEEDEGNSEEDNSFLPGMPVGSGDSSEKESKSSKSSKKRRSKSRSRKNKRSSRKKSYSHSKDKGVEEKLDRVVDQNEKIIGLLKKISKSYN